jgi:Ca-activated chloride channel family protein
MSFEAPVWLLALAVVPLALAGYLLLERRRSRYAVDFTNVSVLAAVAERTAAWRRYLPLALLLAALASLAIALARPTVTLAAPEPRATVILVVDVSGSMRAEDVEPTRLDAAREAIRAFLAEAPEELRVGIVSFSDEPQVVVPPTRDRQLLDQGVDFLAPGFGTAIGDALVRAVELGRGVTEEDAVEDGVPQAGQEEAEEPLVSILLLSDGAQTRGIATPQEGAELARRENIPVYTVALGTDEGTIEVFRFGELQVIPVPPDRETLARIAEATGGRSFDAFDEDQLTSVYEQLGSEVGRVEKPREATVAFVFAGAVLLLAAAALSGIWLPRLP